MSSSIESRPIPRWVAWAAISVVMAGLQFGQETITRLFLHGVRLFLSEADGHEPLHELVNELLLSPMGRRDWPLRFYSPERLFSVEARRKFVPPDIAALP